MQNMTKQIAAKRNFDTWGEVIDRWPEPRNVNFAEDMGVPYGTAVCWKQRNRIPPEYWLHLIAAARLRRLGIQPIDLIALAATYERHPGRA